MASGRPFKPSQHTMKQSATPRLRSLGQQGEPVLGALPAAGADPLAQDVAFAAEADAHRDVDGPVGDGAVSDLHDNRVDQDHRRHAIERPVLPAEQVLDDGVGDPADRVAGHLGAVDLRQICLDVTGRETLRVQRDDVAGQAVETTLALAHRLRVEAGVAVPRDPQLHLTDLRGHDLGIATVAAVASPSPLRACGS